MKKLNYRHIGESIALIGVILSLIFVGLELRQNTIAARASAYQELGIATSEVWYKMASENENIYVSFAEDPLEEYKNLSEDNKAKFKMFQVGTLRLFETVYLQVEQGLLDSSALRSLGWEGYVYNNEVLVHLWPELKPYVDISFANYMENELFTKN